MSAAATPSSRLAGHALVEALVAQGVHTCFGVPGESYLAVLDGFHEHRDRIRFVACRQEGGAAFMAEAQGKLSGRPGICFVTRGPGATNASIGVHTAFQDSTPMVLFVGQVAGDQRDREAFQELDYRQMFGPGTLGLAKWVGEVQHADRLPEYVARAFHVAMQGRPGPVRAGAARGHAHPGRRRHRCCRMSSRCAPGRLPAGCAPCARCCWRPRARSSSPAARAGTPRRRAPCSALPRTGSCRWLAAGASRTPSTTAIRCMPATWASASTRSWPSASAPPISSSRWACGWAK